MDWENRGERNFAYALPQEEGEPVQIVVPTLLQVSWVEAPPFFLCCNRNGAGCGH